LTFDRIRRADLIQDPLCQHDAAAAVGLRLKNREFVAAQPRHGIGVAHAFAQPLRHHPQQIVASGVPQRVVDELEAVEIDHQKRELLALPLAPAKRDLDLPAEKHAVGEAGQRIVVRRVRDRLLVALALE
jgi:hypothetical protein